MGQFIESLGRIISADVQAVNVVAQNNANVNTGGYRAATPFLAYLGDGNSASSFDSIQSKVRYKSEIGSISITRVDGDLALGGEGWFTLETGEGIRFTRNGNFKVDESGYLVNEQDHFVLDRGLARISVGHEGLLVQRTGEIEVNGKAVASLGVFKPGSGAELHAAGNALYRIEGDPVQVTELNVIQGALETSNTDTAEEMVKLIEISRHIETMQRSISYYDDLLKTGVSEIGK